MAALHHLVGLFATHDVHGVACAKAVAAALVGAVHGGQQLARCVGAVPHLGWVQAVVAVAAVRHVHALRDFGLPLVGLVKVAQQPHAAAVGGFCQGQQRIEFAAHDLFELFTRRAFVDHAALVHHVLQAIGHPRIGRQAVAPGAPGFLVVAFDVFGHVQVRHKAHIGLVDAHAKGHGGHHHHAFFAQKFVLVPLAHSGVQTRVVGQGMDARLTQHGRDFFDPLARLAVHHARFFGVFALDEAQQLRAGVFFLDDGVADVGPVKAADEQFGAFQLQALDDVSARQCVGGGRERHAWHRGVALVQNRQTPVLGPEVVAPLAHAMRFVDGEQAEQAAFEQRVHLRQKAPIRHALRRRVQQSDFTAQQAPLDVAGFFAGQGGVEEGGVHARFVQRAHLVVHQRDQRRHHHGDAVPRSLARNGRDLVAKRFAAARGHEHQRIATCGHTVDDGLLRATKGVVAKNFAQDGEVRGHWGFKDF